jgi:prepilin-type processing-associated H-X9-DG protein
VALAAVTAEVSAASSTHPGGVNVALADGAERFIKESIQTWPDQPIDGKAIGILSVAGGSWANIPTPGVWQALGSRNGSEIVETEAF